ncbi:MAG: hypothetical protein K2G96_02070, partial [Clostridia bacterium]|nr:hypothetical protein [Clostridia bacterium]
IMNETQLQAHKYNLKLAGILLGLCGAVMIATFALFLWGTYNFYTKDPSRYDNEMYFLYMPWYYLIFILSTVVSAVVSGIIYGVKHKKQFYDFN